MNFKPTPIQNASELNELKRFLKANNLPHTDIKSDGNVFIAHYEPAGEMIASGGLELYGTSALLRSVAVSQHYRGQNLGKQMVDELMETARDLKVKHIFLLTETAGAFFLKKGFSVVSRETVPAEIKSSSEFTFVCPVSAVCMSYQINHAADRRAGS